VVPVTATAGLLAGDGQQQESGDHRQDQSHDGEPDSGTQPGRATHYSAAVKAVTDGVGDPADGEDCHASDRQ
jgi:hypothetical protein